MTGRKTNYLKMYLLLVPLQNGEWKINMTMDNGPFEDVFPIENGDFSLTTLMLGDGHQPNNRGF